MALLGSFIDVRSNASLAAAASVAFAHGLPATPDFVIPVGLSATTNASAIMPNVTQDATSVTLTAQNTIGTPPLNIISVVAHSVIR